MSINKKIIDNGFSGDKKRLNVKKDIEKQLVKEVTLLKIYDPDKELKSEFEIASLYDLQKYLDE